MCNSTCANLVSVVFNNFRDDDEDPELIYEPPPEVAFPSANPGPPPPPR